jgi:hypothetical protein
MTNHSDKLNKENIDGDVKWRRLRSAKVVSGEAITKGPYLRDGPTAYHEALDQQNRFQVWMEHLYSRKILLK